MNDKHIDELINRALQEESRIPEGLSERLEGYIDQLAADDKAKQPKRARMRAVWWLSGIAASLLLAIGLFFQPETNGMPTAMADTYTDPEDAAAAAKEALAFLSVQLNKGLDQVNEAKDEVEKVNHIVNKQFKELETP